MLHLCPCGSELEYNLCCVPFLSGQSKPQHAAQLMRSRYVAFVINNSDYLVATWHPSRRYPGLKTDLENSSQGTEWLGLHVYEESLGTQENESYVGFVAKFRENGKASAMIERSRFLKENDQWYYVDGIRPDFGRNDTCPCGSGKKFKKCCG